MRIAILSDSDKSVSSLARRLFDLKNASSNDERSAESSLLRENPFLREKQEFAVGKLVVVPEVRGEKFREMKEVSKEGTHELLAAIAQTLRTLETALEEAMQKEKEDDKELRKVVNNQEVLDALKETEVAKETLTSMAELSKVRLKGVTAEISASKLALGGLSQAIKGFMNRQ